MISPEEILEKLGQKHKKTTIGGIEMDIYPLSFPELAHVTPHMDRNNMEYALNYIAKSSLKKSFPEWNDKQIEDFIKNIDTKHLVEYVKQIKELTSPSEGEKKKPSGQETK